MFAKRYFPCLILLVLLMACTKDFEEINTDPNRPKQITPGVMLGQLQYRMVNSSMEASRNFTHELMQVDAPRASTSGQGLHRYVVNPGAGIWTSFYSYLTDIEDIYTTADRLQENNYKAIALVYKSWAYSILPVHFSGIEIGVEIGKSTRVPENGLFGRAGEDGVIRRIV